MKHDQDYCAQVGDVVKIPGKRGLWVVEQARMTGGGTAMFNDYYPDAWHVWARKLNKNKEYNPKATGIEFTQNTNCYNTVIDGVEKIGKMTTVRDFILFEEI